MRSLPNIIITGTPGVGKTTTITELLNLAQSAEPPIPLKHLSINDIVKSRDFEKEISDGEGEGGFIIDWHSTAGFAVRWVDLVLVVRCAATDVLYDRLSKRGYKEEKIQENMDAEIFGVVLEEAKEGWEEEQVIELSSVNAEDVETNAERILSWIKTWVLNQQHESKESG
ncbi:Adenylate kinase isoenzyme-like protein [Cyphellophora attinorum]|uniref:Adenylate kinase isoenzyme-like protein n=1 Tax=Cyphellophora attinorum TaxID=1664694 RepID=A0A0N1H6K1_9EURO|nr:Adenylate kinase isoenzyme-like protein [Phialophora attinorum]KPI41693.1 Adenylate kinase isoenzyme-like protein [Phialophora attinorum]